MVAINNNPCDMRISCPVIRSGSPEVRNEGSVSERRRVSGQRSGSYFLKGQTLLPVGFGNHFPDCYATHTVFQSLTGQLPPPNLSQSDPSSCPQSHFSPSDLISSDDRSRSGTSATHTLKLIFPESKKQKRRLMSYSRSAFSHPTTLEVCVR